jgi:hypothetical protein
MKNNWCDTRLVEQMYALRPKNGGVHRYWGSLQWYTVCQYQFDICIQIRRKELTKKQLKSLSEYAINNQLRWINSDLLTGRDGFETLFCLYWPNSLRET